jgi:putative transposase
MPSRHIVKMYANDAYYHIFNRGVNKRKIFLDEEDYTVFLHILKRHLSRGPIKDNVGREYANYHDEITLLAYCLMPNHFHLLVFQRESQAMTKLLRSTCIAYTLYFNKKYKRVGGLFQGHFKASMITSDTYLQHISRYIHLNPENYKQWKFSSLPYYEGRAQTDWIDPQLILDLFEAEDYATFLADYEGYRAILKEIKSELADK